MSQAPWPTMDLAFVTCPPALYQIAARNGNGSLCYSHFLVSMARPAVLDTDKDVLDTIEKTQDCTAHYGSAQPGQYGSASLQTSCHSLCHDMSCCGVCRHAGEAAADAGIMPSWTTLAAGSLVTATALQALIKAWGKSSSASSSRGSR